MKSIGRILMSPFSKGDEAKSPNRKPNRQGEGCGEPVLVLLAAVAANATATAVAAAATTTAPTATATPATPNYNDDDL